MKQVLIVKTGSTSDSVRVPLGDYDRWFVRSLGASRGRFTVVRADAGERLPPRPRDFDAIIATGSPRSVTERAPWMRPAGDWLRDAADAGVPVLGVCFGHQLLAEAYGGRVGRNPTGREIGTVRCTLTPDGAADVLFEGVPETFEVQATHEDAVVEAPGEATRLVGNPSTPWQAFRVGPRAYGVQFHPEIDAATMRALIESRIARLEAEARARGVDPTAAVRAILAGIRGTPAGPRILENFLDRVA